LQGVLAIGAIGSDRGNDDAVGLAPCFALSADEELGKHRIAQVARQHAERARGALHQAARQGIRHIAERRRRLLNALAGRLGDRALAGQYFADGLEADAGLRGDVLD
jgi:hypothetical protein